MMEPYQTAPNHTSSDLDEVLGRLTFDQIRFVVARNEIHKDKDAAESIGLSPNTVKYWKQEGAPIDEALHLMSRDGAITALHIRRRHLAKAMAVKVKGLDSDDEKVRQDVATELIEWELGKATQKQAIDANIHVTQVVEEIVTVSDHTAASGTEGVPG